LKIHWTRGASRNLEQAFHYIQQENPGAARKVIRKVVQAVESLIEHPHMGRPGRVFDTRELIVIGTPYIVPYRVRYHKIEILRVLHAAMEWPEILG
jgi:toxin ParE1/3/4